MMNSAVNKKYFIIVNQTEAEEVYHLWTCLIRNIGGFLVEMKEAY